MSIIRITRVPLMVAMCCGAWMACRSTKPDQSPTADAETPPPAAGVVSAQAPRAGVKRALLIGINKYKYSDKFSNLAGSVNDVQSIKSVLIGRYDFAPENVVTLVDQQATRQAIVSAIQQHLIAKSQPDDIVVVHFSGHGSRIKIPNAGDKSSGFHQTIVPFDSRDPAGQVFDLSDVELNALMGQLGQKTRNITVILDSCFSGTALSGTTRGDVAATPRFIADDTRTPPPVESFVTSTARGVTGLAPAQFRYVLLSATRSNQVAFEYAPDGQEHGVLSYFLAAALKNARPGATYRDVMDVVMNQVNGQFPNQNPELEGAGADQLIFGDKEVLADTYFPARAGDTGFAVIEGGEVDGFTRDSVFDIYPPGTKQFNASAKRLARARLAKVTAFASDAKLETNTKIPDGSRAVERQHKFNTQFRVFLSGDLNAAPMVDLRNALADLKNVTITDRAASANMQIRLDRGRYVTLTPDGYSLSPPVPVDTPVKVAGCGPGQGQVVVKPLDHIKSQVTDWAKWFNIANIQGSGGPQLRYDVTPAGGGSPQKLTNLNAGEKIMVSVENTSGRDLFISILDLQTDGSISVAFPATAGAAELLKAGATLVRTWDTFVPQNRTFVKDTLKVFASEKGVDLRPLQQCRIRNDDPGPADPDPLSALLADAAGATRGVRETDLGTWSTLQKTILVRKK